MKINKVIAIFFVMIFLISSISLAQEILPLGAVRQISGVPQPGIGTVAPADLSSFQMPAVVPPPPPLPFVKRPKIELRQQVTCSDTDGGMNPFIKGTAKNDAGQSGTDGCASSVLLNELKEVQCNSDGSIGTLPVDCPTAGPPGTSLVCIDGACKEAPITLKEEVPSEELKITSCEDSDTDKEGLVPSVAEPIQFFIGGTVTSTLSNKRTVKKSDECINREFSGKQYSEIIEYYCNQNKIISIEEKRCDDGFKYAGGYLPHDSVLCNSERTACALKNEEPKIPEKPKEVLGETVRCEETPSSDIGKNPRIEGVSRRYAIRDGRKVILEEQKDHCILTTGSSGELDESLLVEIFCEGNKILAENVMCQCSLGACVDKPTEGTTEKPKVESEATIKCSDLPISDIDGGKGYDDSGGEPTLPGISIVYADYGETTKRIEEKIDLCKATENGDNSQLYEYYCEGNKIKEKIYKCQCAWYDFTDLNEGPNKAGFCISDPVLEKPKEKIAGLLPEQVKSAENILKQAVEQAKSTDSEVSSFISSVGNILNNNPGLDAGKEIVPKSNEASKILNDLRISKLSAENILKTISQAKTEKEINDAKELARKLLSLNSGTLDKADVLIKAVDIKGGELKNLIEKNKKENEEVKIIKEDAEKILEEVNVVLESVKETQKDVEAVLAETQKIIKEVEELKKELNSLTAQVVRFITGKAIDSSTGKARSKLEEANNKIQGAERLGEKVTELIKELQIELDKGLDKGNIERAKELAAEAKKAAEDAKKLASEVEKLTKEAREEAAKEKEKALREKQDISRKKIGKEIEKEEREFGKEIEKIEQKRGALRRALDALLDFFARLF